MWKPATVVPHQRRGANFVWGGLVLAALGYGAWQLRTMLVKRSNPNTSLTISNGVFNFPHVTVCLYDTVGCGFADGSVEGCVATARRHSFAYIESSEHVEAIYPSEGDFGSCVQFDLSAWDKVENQVNGRPRVFIEMSWISSDNAAAETTYREGVEMFVGGDFQGEQYTTVPYSRNEQSATEKQFTETVLTIGKTQRKYLGGGSTIVYPVLTTTTTDYVTDYVTSEEFYYDSSSRRKLQSSTTYSSSSSSSTSSDYYVYDDTTMASSDDVYYDTMDSLTDQYATGDLFLTIAQGAYSLTEIEDIDPLEIGTLLGNFGGFWELALLAWGFLYVARYNDEPTLRARGFVETFRLGKSQSSTKKRKLNSGSVQSMPDASVHDEGHQNMGNARRAFSDSGKGGRQNESVRYHDGRGSMVRASFRRPVDLDRPSRGSDSASSSSLRASGASGGRAGSLNGVIREEAAHT